jgi:NAD(P)-dependent dehydrogenase (short-subunit alcohol dehydrogenase family)
MTAEKKEGETMGIPAEILERAVKTIPVGRLGEPEDVARTVLFLCSPDSDYVTGTVIGVNGGVYM